MHAPAQIVVIEDDPASLDLFTNVLRAFGYTVRGAADGAAGLETIRRDPPDLRAIPLIAVTASAMVGDRQSVLAAGFAADIPKPIAPEGFVAQIEASLPAAPARRPGESQPER